MTVVTAAMVPVGLLNPNPANVREDLGDLAELALSIRQVGMLQPLVVTSDKDRYTILDGHRRAAAASQAGVLEVPCLVAAPMATDQQVALMLAAAMHKALTPMEQAHAFAALRNRGLSAHAISLRTGYAPSTVAARLMLLDLPEEAQDMVAAKQITLAGAVRARGAGTTPVRGPRLTWFNPGHPLAPTVRSGCGHTDRARVGGIGCGQCWEDAIRADATAEARLTLVSYDAGEITAEAALAALVDQYTRGARR